MRWRWGALVLVLAAACEAGGNGGTDLPADVPGDMAAEVQADVPADVPAELPADVPADVPPGVPADVPADAAPPEDDGPDAPADVPPDAPADVAADLPADLPADVPPTDVPPVADPVLQCVTGRLPDVIWPRVLRLWLAPDGAAFTARLVESDHHVYAAGPHLPPVEQVLPAQGTANGGTWSVAWEGGGMHVAPDPAAGPVLPGTLDRDGLAPLELHCWPPDAQPPHAYDPVTGDCMDEAGPATRVRLPVRYVSETGRGQCADLGGVALEDEDLYYPQLAGWDLRGANLHDASLHFADLKDARLEGADLELLDFGYAQVTGTVDAHTVIPDPRFGGACQVEDDRLSCAQ